MHHRRDALVPHFHPRCCLCLFLFAAVFAAVRLRSSGGQSSSKQFHHDVWRLSEPSGSWTLLAQLPSDRGFLSYGVVSGRIVAGFGYSSGYPEWGWTSFDGKTWTEGTSWPQIERVQSTGSMPTIKGALMMIGQQHTPRWAADTRTAASVASTDLCLFCHSPCAV